MDADDILPKRRDDVLAALAGEDLDPLSVEELRARITALEAEIARASTKINAAINHKSSADALFRR